MMTTNEPKFNKKNFMKRLKLFYSKESDSKNIYHEVDYLVCINAEEVDECINKSTALMLWLFGLDLLNVITILGKEDIFFVSNKKNVDFLKILFDNTTLLEIDDTDSITVKYFEIDNDEILESVGIEIINAMKTKMERGKIGYFKDECYKSMFAEIWIKVLNTSSFTLIDKSLFAAEIMSIKDEEELEYMKRSCWFSGLLFYVSLNLFSDLLEEVNEKVTLGCIQSLTLSENHTFQALKNVDVAARVDEKFKNEPEVSQDQTNAIKYCFPPIIQSGGFYNLNMHQISDEHYFRDDVIIYCLGIRYKNYCSIIIRTIMVTPTLNLELKKNFKLLQQAHKYIIDNIKDNVELGVLYQDTVDFIQQQNPEMVKHLTDTFGSIIGLEAEDPHFVIKVNCKAIAKKNMVFNIHIGFHSIYDKEFMQRPPHTYSMWLGDCVQVEDHRSVIITEGYKGDYLIFPTTRKINLDV